jgi:hypothetical protein
MAYLGFSQGNLGRFFYYKQPSEQNSNIFWTQFRNIYIPCNRVYRRSVQNNNRNNSSKYWSLVVDHTKKKLATLNRILWLIYYFFFQALKFLHYIYLQFEVASKLSQRSRRKYVTGKIFCQSKIYSNFTIFCILTNVTVRSLRFIYTSVFRGRFHEFVEHN